VAGLALEMKSEFLCLRSFQSGNIGTMVRQNIIDPVRNSGLELGFTMVFSYSEKIEHTVIPLLRLYPGLMAGLTLCDIWSGDVLVDECKVLMLINEDPFFNEADFLEKLNRCFQASSGRKSSNLSFFAEKFGYEPRLHNINEIAQFGKSLVNPEDFEQLMKIVDGIKSPDGENCVEFRLRHSTSGENWMRLEFTKILDSNKTVRRVVGRMVNVDGQKKNIAELQTKAESDSLTGLLNHRAAADRISEFLLDCESDGLCALFVIDIDCFKEINDKFGHFEGDLVLDSAAKIMKELFRASDVVGRIGGDEFIVLMKNLPAKETARAKAEALCKRVRAIRSSDGRRLGITVSAGVAFSHVGAGFEQLYKEADAALYE
ncbi:MAG: sensor domain-containing diguanylate cyclase, partial [Cloacibacillus sp.]